LILVTGGRGHLGANLVRRLLGDGYEVRVLVRQGSDNGALAGLDVQLVQGDLRDRTSLDTAVRGCDRIYHCAALVSTVSGREREIYDCNVLGTRNLLAAARYAGVTRVVVTGSLSATGHDPDRPVDEQMPFYPFGKQLPYSHTKALVEHECVKAVVDGLDTVIATSTAILGPHDFAPSRMGRVLLDFAHRRLRTYVPGGFEFVSAADLVMGHLLAMERGQSGHKYIFSTRFLTMDELMGLYEEVTGVRRPPLRMPEPLMAGAAAVSEAVMGRLFPRVPRLVTPAAVRFLRMRRQADCTKACQELGYRPTSIANAVMAAYECFRQRGLIQRVRKPRVRPWRAGQVR
jgi:nucleoside-diphosphate-sugar epimerase